MRTAPAPPQTGPRSWSLLASAVVATLACGPAPDDLDNGPVQDLVLDPTCTVTSPMEFALFEERPGGETAPLRADSVPALHYGAQGGQHMMIGVSLANPVAASPGVETTITVRRCGTPCVEPQVTGNAVVVNYPQDARWDARADGSVDLGPYVVVLGYAEGEAWTIDVGLRDACARTASLQLQGTMP